MAEQPKQESPVFAELKVHFKDGAVLELENVAQSFQLNPVVAFLVLQELNAPKTNHVIVMGPQTEVVRIEGVPSQIERPGGLRAV